MTAEESKEVSKLMRFKSQLLVAYSNFMDQDIGTDREEDELNKMLVAAEAIRDFCLNELTRQGKERQVQ